MCHYQGDLGGHGAGTYSDALQEARDRGILRFAPEKRAWLSLRRVLNRLYDMTSDRYRERLFYSSRLHGLDSSATNFLTKHISTSMCSLNIDGTARTKKRDRASLIQE